MSDMQINRLRHVISILPVYLLVSFIIQQTLWSNYLSLTHAVMELLCVFMALMIFVLVWYSYDRIPAFFQFIGFCYLIIAIFLLLHSFYFQSFNTTGNNHSLEYIMIARLIEALTFFPVASFSFPRVKREYLLVFSLIVCILTILLVSQYHNYSPALFNPDGYTITKTGLDILILFILVFSAYQINQRLNEKDIMGYAYVYAAIIIAIIITVIFVLQRNFNIYLNILGHVLRILFYYHLFKGVFVSAISFPYEKLEEILDQLPLGVTTYDRDYRFTFANKKAEEVLGYSSKILQGLTDSEIINKLYEDKKSLHLVRELAIKHKVSQAVRTLVLQDGSVTKIVIEGNKLKSGGYLCIFDTAKRIQALENMQLQSQIILDSITNFVVILDPNGKVIMCNKAFSEAIEINKSAIIGLNTTVLLKKIHFSRPDLAEKEFSQTLSNIPLEASIITPSGEKREWLLHMAFIKSIEKEVMGYMAVGTDVTDIKKQQEEAKQKEKLAILGQMASGIVHEIRNPVTAIMGFNQLLQMTAEDKKVKYYCQNIENELNRLNKIVSDFLLFARPRSPVFTELSPNEIVESTKLLIDSYVFSKGIKTVYEYDESIELIRADMTQIEQVILNIVKNAIDVLEDVDEPIIRITTGSDPMFGESYVVIYNNGRALNQEEKQKIGTPFFTTKSKGTGLGFSICKQIISEHGGKITIKSEEDWGTAFELAFPTSNSRKIIAK